MPSFILTPEISKIFVDLGWSDIPSILHTSGFYRSVTETNFYVRLVNPRGCALTHATRMVVGCDHVDARQSDEIKSVTIDVTKPRWMKSLFRWHAMATFKLTDIRAQHAERDRILERKNARREAHALELRSVTGDTGWLVASGCAEDGSYTHMRVNLTLMNKINEALGCLPLDAASKRGGELVALLKGHKFIP